jgi:hypothetical protein
MTGRWRITYIDGTTEETSGLGDKLQTNVNGDRLTLVATRTYGPDETITTYWLANVRKWEPVR